MFFKILFYIHLFVCMPWQLYGDQRMMKMLIRMNLIKMLNRGEKLAIVQVERYMAHGKLALSRNALHWKLPFSTDLR